MSFTLSLSAFGGAFSEAAFFAAVSLCTPQLRAGMGTQTRQPAAHP
jgi:hypothetical protein